MWEADKIYYNGEDDFIKAFQGGKLIWSKVQYLILFTDSDGLTYNGVELVPNQPNYVPVPKDSTMPKIPDGVTEVHWKNYDNRKNNITSLEELNQGNNVLVTFDAEGSNFEGITNMSGMFLSCWGLTTILPMDTSNVTNMAGMFYGCDSLETIPQLNTSNVTDMQSMFNGCSKLTTIPHLDTSNVKYMNGMFWYCSKLTTIPQLNTSNVIFMYSMFYNCSSLKTIPQLDTSNVVYMDDMFWGCSKLTTIPQLNTSNVTKMKSMFGECHSLTTIPQLDTSKVTDMESMFRNCENLVAVPQIDTSSVTNMFHMFLGCGSLENVGGFIGLKVDLDMGYCPLTLESVYNIANNAAVVTEGQTITFSEHTHSLLTDDVIGIFTSKGWTIN